MKLTRRQLRKLILEEISIGSSFIPFPKEAPRFDPNVMYSIVKQLGIEHRQSKERLDRLEYDLDKEKKALTELIDILNKSGKFGSGNMQQDLLKNLDIDV